jgi:hypothetical protein
MLRDKLEQLIKRYGRERVQQTLDEIPAGTKVRDNIDSAVDNWMVDDEVQTTLFKMKRVTPTKVPASEPIEKSYHSLMYRICYGVETVQQALTLDSKQRGRVASVLGRLQEAGADLSQLNHFEDWWKTTWRSRDKQGVYQTPRPDQVIELWWVAVRAIQEKSQPPKKDTPQNVVVDFEERMRQKALERRNNG